MRKYLLEQAVGVRDRDRTRGDERGFDDEVHHQCAALVLAQYVEGTARCRLPFGYAVSDFQRLLNSVGLHAELCMSLCR